MDILHSLHTLVQLIYETLASLYYSLLLIGAIGIAAQGVFGFMHGGGSHAGHAHAGGHGGGGHGGHHAGDVPLGNHHTPIAHHTPGAVHGAGGTNTAAPSSSAAHAHSGTHTGQHTAAAGGAKPAPTEREMSPLWSWLSPMTIFSVCLGTGAAGLLLVAHLGKPLTALVALLCGAAFYACITKPMMRVVLGFASKPADNLAGAVTQNAVAMNRFDAQGRGMVTVTVDGELKRLLAHLDKEDTENAVVVAPGDTLLIVSIDPQKNTCAVMKV